MIQNISDKQVNFSEIIRLSDPYFFFVPCKPFYLFCIFKNATNFNIMCKDSALKIVMHIFISKYNFLNYIIHMFD